MSHLTDLTSDMCEPLSGLATTYDAQLRPHCTLQIDHLEYQ